MKRSRPFALAVVLLVAASGCSDGDDGSSNDVSVAYGSDDVVLSKPELRVAPSGAWRVSADFAWRTCGERGCWTFDERRHGGPDVFGVSFGSGPRFTVQSKRLTLQSSCGDQEILNDAVVGDEGVFFVVQEKTGKKGECRRSSGERAFNMASGQLEVVISPIAGTPCGPLISVDSLFAHSYAETGRDVKINAGRTDDGRRIDWGPGDQVHQFTAIAATPGTYDCSGTEK